MKAWKRDFSIIATICIIITILFISYQYSHTVEVFSILEHESAIVPIGQNETDELEGTDEENHIEIQSHRVYISGEVLNPGVYNVDPGARVADLLDLAGGSLEDAELTRINLAAYINDADHIFIPKVGDIEIDAVIGFDGAEEANEETVALETGPVNINTAQLNRLTSLPGIGEAIGQNIIDYREANGGFRTKEEIKNVNRIGERLYEQIEHLITVD